MSADRQNARECLHTARSTADPASILLEAHALVHGDRGANYGHPIEDFTRSAAIASILLKDKLLPGVTLGADDIPKIMIAVKLSRLCHAFKWDSVVDVAGYCETWGMVRQRMFTDAANAFPLA